MRTYLALAALLALAACATPEERAARVQKEVDEMIQTFGPGCEKLGYKPDTDPWRECVLKLSTKDSIDRYTNRPVTSSCFGHRGFYQCTSL